MTFRLGVLGCGRQAGIAIARAWSAPWDVRLIGGRDLARAGAFIATHRLPDARACSLREVVDGEVDAIYVGLPNELHEAWTLDALRAGKSVLVEKPLALSAASCALVEETRRARGLCALEGIMIEHHPWVARLVEKAAALGNVLRMRTEFHFEIPAERLARLPSPASGGGALRDVAPYWLFLVSLFAPLDPVEVEIEVARAAEAEVAVRTISGFRAELSASYRGPFRARLVVELERGTLTVPNIFRANLGPQSVAIECSTPVGETREQVGGGSAFAEQLRAFAALCRGDEPARRRAMAAALSRQRVVDQMVGG